MLEDALRGVLLLVACKEIWGLGDVQACNSFSKCHSDM